MFKRSVCSNAHDEAGSVKANRICLILKMLNSHIQYGHPFKTLGMYFKTMRKFYDKMYFKMKFYFRSAPRHQERPSSC